jgi:hypothetical protein
VDRGWARSAPLITHRAAVAAVDQRHGLGPLVHGGPGQGVMPRFNLGCPLWIGRLASPTCDGAAAGTPEGGGARWSRPSLSSRSRFDARTGSTRREERGELTQGLREVTGVTAEAPRRPWRAAQGRRAVMGATTRFVRNKREDEVPYLAVMPRVKRTEAGRQWR